MSLEARIELLTAAVIELTAAIGGMQAPAETSYAEVQKDRSGGERVKQKEAQIIAEEISESAISESLTASAPTGESSSPALDYVKHVKPITLRLSSVKGRKTTIAVLQRFGVKGAQDLEATQWAEYIAHCEKVLAGGDV